MKFCGPGGIRTLDLFSAIDEQVGEKEEKNVYYVPKSPYCASISVPELFPNCSRSMKQGRRSANLSKWGFYVNDVHEKHRLNFSFSFP